MSERDDLVADLAEAKATRHAVLTGKRTIMTRHGEKQIQRDRVDLPALERYIASLQRQIDAIDGVRGARFGVISMIPMDSNS